MVILYLISFLIGLFYFGGIFYLISNIINFIDMKIIYIGIIGYSAANFSLFMRLPNKEIQNAISFIKNKKIVMYSVIINLLDFTIAIVVGSLLYVISSSALIVPLIWFSVEYYLIEKGLWYLTPGGLMGKLLFLVNNVDLRRNYMFVGSATLFVLGKVQKNL